MISVVFSMVGLFILIIGQEYMNEPIHMIHMLIYVLIIEIGHYADKVIECFRS